MASRFYNPVTVLSLAILARVGLLAFGHYQDTHSPMKYTDIDYFVFTDAARFVSRGHSPYQRDTYRYTPLLAWFLLPTASPGLFDFGKWLFALGDVVAGALIYSILRGQWYRFDVARASKYAAVWALNPMVANISTRGSSEGLLTVFVVAILWAALQRRWAMTGALLGFAVHFKIYPFIYGASLLSWLYWGPQSSTFPRGLLRKDAILFVASAAVVFAALNIVMYQIYGKEFLEHSYFYHVKRIDHRHNFSIWNTLLHLKSASGFDDGFRLERIAFLPQILLSCILIPLGLGCRDLASTMMAQTLAFVTFNKVCTSQYFLWYLVFLPLHLPDSSLMQRPRLGLICLVIWILGQAVWLQQGFQLEFLGNSTFTPGLWMASLMFFVINCVILGIVIMDIDQHRDKRNTPALGKKTA